MNIIFTTCTYNHIGRALSLKHSVEERCQNVNFIVCLVDKLEDRSLAPGCEFFSAESLQLPFLDEMLRKYTALELNSALKPYFAQHLLNTKKADQIIYLDSDILLYEDIVAYSSHSFEDYSILISPHALSSPIEDTHQTDRNFLRSGIYNAGFFAVKNDVHGNEFLDWWKGKLKNHCFINASEGMFAEQLWLNLAPLYHPKTKVIKDPGVNVAYWNLHERNITLKGGKYLVNNQHLLIFFHFSGATPQTFKENKLTVHASHYTLSDRPELLPLFTEYNEALSTNNHGQYDQYYTVSKKFKTKSKLLIFILIYYKKVVRNIFYKK